MIALLLMIAILSSRFSVWRITIIPNSIWDHLLGINNWVSIMIMKNILSRGSLLFGLVLGMYSTECAAGSRYRGGYYGGGYGGGYSEVYDQERAINKADEVQKKIAALREEKAALERKVTEFKVAGDVAASLEVKRKQRDSVSADLDKIFGDKRLSAKDRSARIADAKNHLAHIDAQIARLDALIVGNEKLEARDIDAEIKLLEATLPELVEKATGRREMNVGQLVAKGIAGEDFYLFDSGKCTGFWDGMKQGLILGTAKEFGDFVRIKMRVLFQDKLGSIFDATINGLSDGFQLMKEALFHGSQKPFTEDELSAWSTHIGSVFENISTSIKGGMRDIHRGQDSTMRQTNNDMDDVVGASDGDVVAKSEEKNIWAQAYGGFVLQLSYYILILQDRKGYYNPGSFEVFFATHIEERLKEFCGLLAKVTSIADLESHVAVNSAVIPLYKSNIENLFKQLQQKVKPRSFSVNSGSSTSIFDRDKTSSSRMKGRYSSGYDADDESGPQTGWAR